MAQSICELTLAHLWLNVAQRLTTACAPSSWGSGWWASPCLPLSSLTQGRYWGPHLCAHQGELSPSSACLICCHSPLWGSWSGSGSDPSCSWFGQAVQGHRGSYQADQTFLDPATKRRQNPLDVKKGIFLISAKSVSEPLSVFSTSLSRFIESALQDLSLLHIG